jgi:hypothetical protein
MSQEGGVMDRLLNNEQAAAVLGIAPGTLEYWRIARCRRGPAYIRLESGTVRYQLSDLQSYIEKHRVVMDKGKAESQNG